MTKGIPWYGVWMLTSECVGPARSSHTHEVVEPISLQGCPPLDSGHPSTSQQHEPALSCDLIRKIIDITSNTQWVRQRKL